MTQPYCPARKILLRGCRPKVQTSQIAAGLCLTECIFCDIWQLSGLVQSYTPLTIGSRSSSPQSRAPSPSSDAERSLRSVEQQFQTQRARLTSILSICVFDGAQESEGLRLAHDRCLSAITSLLNQRAILDQMIQFTFKEESSVSSMTPIQGRTSQRSLRRESGSCSLRDSYFIGRRNSQMGMAM